MSLDCCVRSFSEGQSVCNVCYGQRSAEIEDRQKSVSSMTGRLNRNAIAARWPARREVFRLLGIYLGEREARALLNRIHEYKWLEAEKAGFDIWQVPAPKPDPLAHAAKRWAGNHFDAWRTAKSQDAA